MEEERILVVCGIIKNMLYLFTGRYRVKARGNVLEKLRGGRKGWKFPTLKTMKLLQ